MATIIFLWALLSTPTDKIICEMWTRAITQADMMTSCGTLKLEGYRVDVYSLTMQFQCSKPATDLPNIKQVCGLNGALDEYIIRIIEPAFSELLCMVESTSKDKPLDSEIAEQCPGVKDYIVQYAGERAKESAFACRMDVLPVGNGLYDQASNADDLYTDDDLTWLAGQLIWNGTVKTQCTGEAGVNPRTLTATPCGNLAARADVLAWQNQFNTEIYTAALAYNVPARLLKRMMIIESQFWPYYQGEDGEEGIMQITDNGMDTLLRFDLAIDPDYLTRDDENKLWSRVLARETFTCRSCKMEEVIQHIKKTMPYYARLLAAYHCRAVTVNPALVGPDSWRQSVVDYNGSGDYLLQIEK